MKRIYLLFALCSVLTETTFAQTLIFARNYGGLGYDDARGMALATDGCLVFTGLSNSGPDSLGDMYLTKVNAAGAVLWTHYYGRPKEDGGNFVLHTSDGGYLISGHTAFSTGEECDGFLVKTDANGQELWRSIVGTAYDDVCNGALEMEDGTFIVVGRVENEETHSFRVLFAKISSKGEQIWLKDLETDLPSLGFRIVRSSDGNLLVAGYSYHPDQFGTEMMVLKCDLEGHVLWNTQCGTSQNDRAYALIPTPDGGCVAVGGASDINDHLIQMEAFRLSANGAISASNVQISTSEGYLFDIAKTADGRMAVAGVLKEPNAAFSQPVLGILKDDLSVSEWETVRLPSTGRTRALMEDKAGNLLLCGNVEGLQGTPDDIFLAKTPPLQATSGVKDVEASPYLLFPNPFHDFTYLKIGEPAQSKTLTISALDGKKLRHTTFDSAELFVYRNGLLPGLYLFTVNDGDGKLLTSGKLVVK